MERLKTYRALLSRVGYAICLPVSQKEFEAESLYSLVLRLKVRGRVAKDAVLTKTRRAKGGGRVLFFEVPHGAGVQRPSTRRGKAVEKARKDLGQPNGRDGSPPPERE